MLNDLLDKKEEIKLNEQDLGFFKGKSILITGAYGFLGTKIAHVLVKAFPERLLLLGQDAERLESLSGELWKICPEVPVGLAQNNIRERLATRKIFAENRPSVVIHAASHKHVSLMENQVSEAVKNNILGTWNVAQAAIDGGCSAFVLLSSRLAANPASALGASKRIAEFIVRSLNKKEKTRFNSVRLCNVLGSTASVAHVFQEQILRGSPLTITHPDMKRFFMSPDSAANLCILSAAKNLGEVITPDIRTPLKILDLANHIASVNGLKI
ncbi:MAG: polysaccharide biosynthesis protein, partial [bacterium]